MRPRAPSDLDDWASRWESHKRLPILAAETTNITGLCPGSRGILTFATNQQHWFDAPYDGLSVAYR